MRGGDGGGEEEEVHCDQMEVWWWWQMEVRVARKIEVTLVDGDRDQCLSAGVLASGERAGTF